MEDKTMPGWGPHLGILLLVLFYCISILRAFNLVGFLPLILREIGKVILFILVGATIYCFFSWIENKIKKKGK